MIMRKLIAIGLFVNAALLAGNLMKRDVIVHAAGGGGSVPAGNGDVNGDGTIDISDAVYLLSHMFLAGPAPVAIECPAAKGLPATGQTKCYKDVGGLVWLEVPCDEAPCQGQDGSYARDCPSAGRFIDHGDGTVTDTCTGLMWQKQTADVDGDGFIGAGDQISWCDAVNYCQDLSFAGYYWRLPNVRELQSIVDYGRLDPSIDPVFESETDWYWTSTSVTSDPGSAWYIGFGVGEVTSNSDGKVFRGYLRAVRNAQ